MDEQYLRKPPPKFNLSKWFKKTLLRKNVLPILLIIVLFVFFIMFSNKGIIKRLSLESEKKEIMLKINQAQVENEELQKQSKALDSDPKTIEKVAREKYGMVREGETVYKVRKEK